MDFSKAIFKGKASFRRTTFEGSVDFEEPDYSRRANGSKQYSFNARVDFSMAIFEKRARFIERRLFDTNLESVTFRDALIEWPGNVSLDRVQLRPSWFIDTNVQGFRFTNVQWRGLRDGPQGSIEEEIEAIDNRRTRSKEKKEEEEESQIGYPHDVLAKTCRELSANAEYNREYPLANEFHYWSMDTLRKESWSHFKAPTFERLAKKETRQETWHDIRKHFGLVTTLYWALSGYGVRAGRALGVLGLRELRVFSPEVWWLPSILAGFPAFVPSKLDLFSGTIVEGITHTGQAMVYSLSTLARLNPEPRPGPGLFQFLVTVEGILGPLQIALLALAVRRKVMR